MTLFTSDTDKLKSTRKCFKAYLAVTVFVLVFGAVYEIFSHGVISLYMMLAFLIPLVFGVLPFGIIALLKKNYYPTPLGSNSFHSGVATLTVGSIMKGVFDIYGTTSTLIPIYNIVGIVLVTFGVVYSIIRLLLRK